MSWLARKVSLFAPHLLFSPNDDPMNTRPSPTEPSLLARFAPRARALSGGFPLVLFAGLVLGSATGCLKLRTGEGAQPPSPTMAKNLEQAEEGYEILDVEQEVAPSPHFVKDGQPYCYAGTNNYYLIYKSKRMVDDVLESAAAMGLSVMRFWAFLDKGADNSEEGGTKQGVYFRKRDATTGELVFNEDEQTGLPRLDYVLHKARELGITLVPVLTNNWDDFGGMDQYVRWFDLQHHHEFYTDERARSAYKAWVKHVVERVNTIDGVPYREDPAVFAWELANEPRAINYESFDSQTGWDTSTITRWVDEMSSYVKSLDPNHMVSTGDEGFLASGKGYETTGGDWAYEAPQGIDHKALTALPNIDLGTFHLYPDHWGMGFNWGNDWIQAHIDVARELGKPTVLEEYGVVVRRNEASEIIGGWGRREAAYRNWNELMIKRGGAGTMFWILVGVDDDQGVYPDYDHFSLYRNDRTHQLLEPYWRRQSTEAQACSRAPRGGYAKSPFISNSLTAARAELDAEKIAIVLGGAPLASL